MTSVTDFVIVYCMFLKIHVEVRPNSTGAATLCCHTCVSSSTRNLPESSTPTHPANPTPHRTSGWNVRTPYVHLRLDKSPCDKRRLTQTGMIQNGFPLPNWWQKLRKNCTIIAVPATFQHFLNNGFILGSPKKLLKGMFGKTGNNAVQWQSAEN